jgi:hypothetical protein
VKRLALGLASFAFQYHARRACALAEFKFSQRRVYELLNAAEVSGNFPEFPEKPESEGQLNELAKLRIEGTHEYDTPARVQVGAACAEFTKGVLASCSSGAASAVSNRNSTSRMPVAMKDGGRFQRDEWNR